MMWSKVLKCSVLFLVTCSIMGCSALQISETDQKRIAVQYATVKLISQSGDITSGGVLKVTGDIRDKMETDLDVDLRDLISLVPVDHLDPADQILVSALFQQIRYSVEELPRLEASEGFRERVGLILSWIDEAARMAQ